MIRRLFIIIVLAIELLATIDAKAELTMALVSSYDTEFDNTEYNNALIRSACVETLGKDWVKEKIFYDSRQLEFCVYLSEFGNMEIQSSEMNLEELKEIRTVMDYMASRNDTLYLRVDGNTYITLTSKEMLSDYIRKESYSIYDSILFASPKNLLRIVEYNLLEMWNIPMMMGYGPVMLMPQTQSAASKKDVDLYYEYMVEGDRYTLDTARPQSSIITGICYSEDKAHSVYYIQKEYIEE